jgi:SPP1 family predicted phage head-tail adaptor
MIDDGYGNTVSGDWATGPTVGARIKPLRGGEAVQAARLAGKQPLLITIRYSSATAAITTDWRARNARTGALYNIRSVMNPDERKRFLDLEVEMGVAV